LHAEKQLTAALPKMAAAARASDLKQAFEDHLQETETQIGRIEEAFSLLGVKAAAKPCKGMAGLIEEGTEVMKEAESKDDGAADLAIIGAAQKVEHYEFAGYMSARALASQAGYPRVARLLNESLAEEERADKILNRIATFVMETTSREMLGTPPESEGATEQEGNGRSRTGARPKMKTQPRSAPPSRRGRRSSSKSGR
jgi:Mn-containing catalase